MRELSVLSIPLAILCAAAPLGIDAMSRCQSAAQTGNAGITGAVVDDRGQPVSHAAVFLSLEDDYYASQTYSDAAGTFGFRGLLPGAFSLKARKAGLTTTAAGQRDPFGPAPLVRVAAGQNVVVRIVMPRTGALTGRVTSRGRPIRSTIEATRRSRVPIDPIEEFQLRNFSNTSGDYRIGNLPPGDYTVTFVPPPPWSIIRPPEGAADAPSVWLPTYFGGGWDYKESPPVTIRPGEERTGVDFDVAPMPLSRVELVVEAPPGVDPESLVPAIERVGDYGYLLRELPAAPRWATDRFVFDAVPPGRYDLDLGMPRATTRPFHCGSKRVTVTGATVTVKVPLVANAPLSGTVAIEAFGGPGPRLERFQSWARLEAVDVPCDVETQNIGMGGETSFTIFGVPAGGYVIHANDQPGWFVRAVSIDGKDVLDAITTIPPQGVSNLVVHVTRKQPGIVRGRLLDATGRALPEGRVVLFAVDRRVPDTDVERTRLIAADSNGLFEIEGLHAGEYAIAATDATSLDEVDRAFMTRIESSATRIVVTQGDVVRIEVRALSTVRRH